MKNIQNKNYIIIIMIIIIIVNIKSERERSVLQFCPHFGCGPYL